MIQVCSQCGTRWNVRERQRVWCPRCRGALMAPLTGAAAADPQSRTSVGPQRVASTARRAAPRLPPGFRWIAVRPGAAPPHRPRRRAYGPTPRYTVMPRWGLGDRVAQPGPSPVPVATKTGPAAATVRTLLFATMLVLGAAAFVYAVRYVLLIINRDILLNSVLAGIAVWVGVAVSFAALAAMGVCFVVLTKWLVARRAAAFAYYGLPEHRSTLQLWAGCLTPLANLLWAPVYLIELAVVEDTYQRLKKPILVWWIAWVVSTATSLFAIATSFSSDAQGIANNTVMVVVAYALAAAAVGTVSRVFEGFERKPVQRPAHRWLVMGQDDQPGRSATDEDDRVDAAPDADAVELEGQEPAA
ncbi:MULTISPECIES: DUF4328 domain-containing protein [Mycobacterium ulcerans group]|nr:DUF4328 domain-containing protein [Mycobacterium liflandii]